MKERERKKKKEYFFDYFEDIIFIIHLEGDDIEKMLYRMFERERKKKE